MYNVTHTRIKLNEDDTRPKMKNSDDMLVDLISTEYFDIGSNSAKLNEAYKPTPDGLSFRRKQRNKRSIFLVIFNQKDMKEIPHEKHLTGKVCSVEQIKIFN